MLTRRSFLGMTGSALMGAAALALGGCGESRGAASSAAAASAGSAVSSEVSATSGAASSAAASADASAASTASASAGGAPQSDALVLYFSRADENYEVGFVEEGNTSIVAKMIAEKTGADLFEIEPAEAYPEGYDDCCDVALAEQKEGARPAYVGDIDIASYTTIYLGYPIWWGDLPMCVYTFLEAHDWAGKQIHPFCTHQGSGLSGTDAAVRSTCAGAEVGEGLSLEGAVAQNSRDEAEAAVDAWLA